MTIEAHLQSIDASLQVIATALTAIAEGSGATSNAVPAAKPADSKPKGKATTTKAKAKKEEPPAEEEATEEAPSVTLNDVRAALTALQKAAGAEAPKGLLKEFKATTLSKLSTDQYQAIIDRAGELKSEAEAE